MKVLITGASGFLGGHLVDQALAAGDQVRVVLRPGSKLNCAPQHQPQVEIIRGDLTDPALAAVLTRGMDVVYHSAALLSDVGRYEIFHAANVLASQYLVDAAKANQVARFVFVSSPSIFTDHLDHLQMDESVPYPKQYANYYAQTKAISEQYVLAANRPGFTTCSLRPRGIWGPRDIQGFLPKLSAAMASGKLKLLAPGKNVQVSICHVTNIAQACLAAARSDRVAGQAYFITDAEVLSLWDFLNQIAQLFGLPPITKAINPLLLNSLVNLIEFLWRIPVLKHHRAPPISRYAVGLLTLHSTYNCAKAKRDFGYVPSVSHAQGVAEWKAWVDANGGLEFFRAK